MIPMWIDHPWGCSEPAWRVAGDTFPAGPCVQGAHLPLLPPGEGRDGAGSPCPRILELTPSAPAQRRLAAVRPTALRCIGTLRVREPRAEIVDSPTTCTHVIPSTCIPTTGRGSAGWLGGLSWHIVPPPHSHTRGATSKEPLPPCIPHTDTHGARELLRTRFFSTPAKMIPHSLLSSLRA